MSLLKDLVGDVDTLDVLFLVATVAGKIAEAAIAAAEKHPVLVVAKLTGGASVRRAREDAIQRAKETKALGKQLERETYGE